ncbi:hypothetical protein D3Z63_24860 [Vibrio parahaemolyticus]|uniref:Uncharacterized protein n=1 Tax=Vibrio parahaemolyticus TaxID=670 RepID=A0A249W561_VIBPH|nr:hypothetical protein YA91_15650 [Vibrio parahaemolyticus]OQT00254.1 hypothetical protein EN04_008705 [Vibrio parahaemolyticus O4:K12 str. K1203]AUT87047.1 hypothetical protein RK51_009705 [Vibrio parahaemolyticus]EGQ9080125.1 hypothetical protein [Vibrio parahaemolyticus]EGQ9085017.1 hypothetical protein [Vibrio parahaemolyticus]
MLQTTLLAVREHKIYNKAFKSDSQRLAVSLRSSIAKRRSHLNAALGFKEEVVSVDTTMGIQKFGFH